MAAQDGLCSIKTSNCKLNKPQLFGEGSSTSVSTAASGFSLKGFVENAAETSSCNNSSGGGAEENGLLPWWQTSFLTGTPVVAATERDEAAYTYGLIAGSNSRFPHPLSLYKHLPDVAAVSISFLEDAAVQRLRVLNFLHERFGSETSLSPSTLLRKSHTTGAVGKGGGSQQRNSSNNEASAPPAAATKNTVLLAAEEPQQSLRQLRQLLLETGLMADGSACRNSLSSGGCGGGGYTAGCSTAAAAAAAASAEARRTIALRDAVSHFALRIGFSGNKERQQWFVRQESRLFLFRVEEFLQFSRTEGPASGFERDAPFDTFLAREGLFYDFVNRPRVSESVGGEIWRRATEFRGDSLRANGFSFQEFRLFLVPFFPDAASLVARRRVYIHRSIAYVPQSEMDQVLLSKFRHHLQESLRLLETRQSLLQETVFKDPRIGELLAALPTAYIGKDFQQQNFETSEDRLSLQSLQQVWKVSFPPCMRRLFGAYQKDRHMRHSGRLQLWLFFKGAGLRMEENLQVNRSLWENPQKFDREHAYTIRHIYGSEGKRADYPPLSCAKIISGGAMLQTPGMGDYHGCPFKHLDKPQIYQLLLQYQLTPKQVNAVLQFKESNEFQLACKELFVQTHPGSTGDGVGNHPNHFYEASRRYHRRKRGSSNSSNVEAQKEPAEEEMPEEQ